MSLSLKYFTSHYYNHTNNNLLTKCLNLEINNYYTFDSNAIEIYIVIIGHTYQRLLFMFD